MTQVNTKFTDHSKLVAKSIAEFPRQLTETWETTRGTDIPSTYRKAKDIIFCGMGGSNLASELIRGLFVSEIKLPFVLVRNYHLPAFASKDSLVVISSYSGDTDESISCLKQAIELKAKIVCICSGGKIGKIATEKKLPLILLDKKLNVSGQPRYGLGSQLGAVLALFDKCKFINITASEIKKVSSFLEELNSYFAPTVYGNRNLARNTAKKFKGYLPVIMAADFLMPNAHILTNQINESAKTLSIYNAIPELNHHLMEGLELPIEVIKKVRVLLLDTDLYPKEIKNRFSVTKKVLEKKKIQHIDQKFTGQSKLLVAMEALAFGNWLSFYLSQINHKDPTLIPWVDYFKARLKRMK